MMAAQWFSNFLLKPLVKRVNRRRPILTERFWRSMCDVQMRSGSGCPQTGTTSVFTMAYLYGANPSVVI